MIIFEITNPLETSDNYMVRLKGFVKLSEAHDEEVVVSIVETAAKRHLAQITLMEALELVNADKAEGLISKLGDISSKVTKLEFSTVDAVEKVEQSSVNVDIDPSLESQKQKQGFFSRVKNLFKR